MATISTLELPVANIGKVILTQPVVNPEIGDDVEQHDLPGIDLSRQVVERASNEEKTDIRDGDQRSLRVGPQRTNGVNMAVSEHLPAVFFGQTLVSGTDIEQHVQLPSEKLMSEQSNSVIERSLLDQLHKLAEQSGLLVLNFGFSGRHKDNVLVDMGVVTVMSAMGDLPGKERHHEKRVHSPANNIVELVVCREGTVTTFVADNPHSDANAALDKAVKDPSGHSESRRRQKINLQREEHQH